MNKIEKELFLAVTDLHEIPQGAVNVRKNGEGYVRNSTADIQIIPKKNKSGIDVFIKPNIVNKSVHIPVLITMGGVNDLVYNDFYVGEHADVTIIAGCGIHNSTNEKSEHDGIHTFHLEKNSKVKYIEKHIGLGNGSGKKVLNPITKVILKENSFLEMETIQLGGVTSSKRTTNAKVYENAKLVIKEKILTTNNQTATTNFKVELIKDGSSVEVISRSVAKNNSKQVFNSYIIGKCECFGHVECDGIIIDQAKIASTPKILCENVNATLVHEAAIGKIAGEQLIKLETLGLTEKEAEDLIIKGFLS